MPETARNGYVMHKAVLITMLIAVPVVLLGATGNLWIAIAGVAAVLVARR